MVLAVAPAVGAVAPNGVPALGQLLNATQAGGLPTSTSVGHFGATYVTQSVMSRKWASVEGSNEASSLMSDLAIDTKTALFLTAHDPEEGIVSRWKRARSGTKGYNLDFLFWAQLSIAICNNYVIGWHISNLYIAATLIELNLEGLILLSYTVGFGPTVFS